MDPILFWQQVCDGLDRGDSLILLLVAAAEGSSPGRPGFKMAVGKKNLRFGTIGGGSLEKTLVDQAVATLGGELAPPSWTHFAHRREGDTAVPSGMICSGGQSVVVLPLEANDKPAIDLIVARLSAGQGISLRVDTGGLHVAAEPVAGTAVERVEWDPAGWNYQETLLPPPLMTIVGGGHVGLALTQVLVLLGYRVVVLDDRPELDTLRENRDASEIRVIDYMQVAGHVPEGARSQCVIMTHGHLADELVLRQLAGRRFGYLGLMGSRSKVAELFDRLAREGVSREWLETISAPVGLPIGSQTPAEIAVSIAADLVRRRRQQVP